MTQLQKLNRDYNEFHWGTKEVYVEFETSYGNFIIQMAPFDLMPHVTNWFLSLAESQYWKGCAFIRNANHVMQANCGPKKYSIGESRISPSIAFQEYSDQYTHEVWTVG